jgi:phosphate transport system substrate-binding protein
MHMKTNYLKSFALAAGLLVAAPGLPAQAIRVDDKLPEYKPVSGISGKLSSIGSDTLNNLLTYGAEEFKKI